MATDSSLQSWFTQPNKGLVRAVRPSQLRMAEAVAQIAEDGGIAFLEAGTGTGKSFAYGLPALLSDKRVVISTGKKALQEQLYLKDLPHLARVVRPAPYAIVKGKGNYACRLRLEEFRGSSSFASVPAHEVAHFESWLDDPQGEHFGDTSGLNYPWLHHVRVSECIRAHCPHGESCAYVRGRDKARLARILVINHALLAQDLAIGGGKILGAYDVLIIDEGHQAPKFFRDAYSLHLHPRQPEVIQRALKDSDFDMGDGLARLYLSIFSAFPNRAGEFYLSQTLQPLFAELYGQTARMHDLMSTRGIFDDEDRAPAASEMARMRIKLRMGGMMLGRVKQLCSVVLNLPQELKVEGDEEGALPPAPVQEWVKFTEKLSGDAQQLVVTPLEVGPLVAPALLGIKSVIVTSATLSTANGMDYMAREYGLSGSQIREKAVFPSPFDYAGNSVLYVSSTTPDPSTRNAEYYDAMCREIHELLDASLGGAFVLCASSEDMEAFHNGIYRLNIATRGPVNYRLFMQKGANPEQLMNWFYQDKRSVLVGLKTYWEGVDVPGDRLRLVVIPRLPFPNRGDVLLTARKKAFENALLAKNPEMTEEQASIRAWESFDFQEAIMDLKQGGGRLIRTETDTGVVALLDRRAYARTKAYSAKVRRALPHPETYDKAPVLELLRNFGLKAQQT